MDDEGREFGWASHCDAWSVEGGVGGRSGGQCLATSAPPCSDKQMKGETIGGRGGGVRRPAMILASKRRTNEGSFAYIPHRFLRGGFWESCSQHELCLYVLLTMVSDPDGMSYYGHRKLCSLCKLDEHKLRQTIRELEEKDLIACRGPYVQVLSLPPRPLAHLQQRQMPRQTNGEPTHVRTALKAFLARMERSAR